MKPMLMLFILSLSCLGCAAKFRVPGNRFLVPESSGGLLNGDAKAGLAGTADIQVADNTTSTDPDTTPDIGENSDPAMAVQLGLMSRLDVYYTNVMGAGDVLGMKFQLLGDPMLTSASGNFSLALAGGAIFGEHDESSTSGNVTAQTTYDRGGWEALVMIGYRPNNKALLYLNPFVTHVETDVTIEHVENGNSTVVATPNGTGDMKGLTLGLRIGKNFFLNIEGTYFVANWKRTHPSELEAEEFSEGLLGAALGGSW